MTKRIIFDVGHPAQVHNFKHIYWSLKEKGWEGLFSAKDKEVTLDLLNKYDLPYVLIGRTNKGIFSKIFGLLGTTYRFIKVISRFKPDIIICRFSPHACWVGKLFRIPVIGLADSEHTKLLDSITVPFADVKLTAFSYTKNLGKNHIRFDANIEIFYLHPNRFKKSNDIESLLGISKETKYSLVRFVSWGAHHDIGESGLTNNQKIELVKLLSSKFKVFITSEKELPKELRSYQIKISPEQIHDVLANANIYVGEGASMASEAACLGVPSFYINTLTAGSIQEEQRFGLLQHLTSATELLSAIKQTIENHDILVQTKEKRDIFINNKIDVTAFLVWFIENYPQSVKIMKENPDYQYNFK